MIGSEDTKTTIDKFLGFYQRGSTDEVPIDHAQSLLNVSSTSVSRIHTRSGLVKSLAVGYAAGGVRRFFEMESIPPNINEPFVGDINNTSGENLLILDNNNNFYIGNDPTPIFNVGGASDFCALNMGNRTYFSPNDGVSGLSGQGGHLKVINSLTGTYRDAAGLAPAQTVIGGIGSWFLATNSATVGNVPAGLHQFAVIYQTDTGYWTQPGPKINFPATVTASTAADQPTVITILNHNCNTGESHSIRGATGAWGIINDCWHVTVIDANNFSIPVNTFGMAPCTDPVVCDAGFHATSVECTGGFQVNINNIPSGPPGTVARLILATQANQTQFFFVPQTPTSQGVIMDNTTGSCVLNFFDTDLIDSADYLFDLLEAIPGGGGMTKYAGRMVIAGPYFPGNAEAVLLSNVEDPETFDYVSGVIRVQTENDGNVVCNAWVLRDVLYMQKFTGTFGTQDNGGDPSSWAINVIDGVIGSYAYGVSSFISSQNTADTGDVVLVAHKSGLYMFDGVFLRPELSFKIGDYWKRINFAAFYRVTVTNDPWNKMLYISIPLDASTEPNALIACDYSAGRDPDSIRFYLWQFHRNPTCIGMAFINGVYALNVGSIDANSQYIWALSPTATSDDGNIIVSNYSPGPLSFGLGGVNFFKLLNFRAWGAGQLNLTLSQEDGGGVVSPPPLVLSSVPGRDLQRQINFVNEKMNLLIGNGNNLNDQMFIDRIDVWGLMQWPLRPSV
jgi:hypothetical protein